MQPVLIGVHHYQQILILKGNLFKRTFLYLFNFICRELFGIHPAGINFELYDDIPVEASHMDHPPIDTVRITNYFIVYLFYFVV